MFSPNSIDITERHITMHIYSVFDPEFASYGNVMEGFDTAELLTAMNAVPLPAEGVSYEPAIPSLEECSIFQDLKIRAFGGMPTQLGLCWGHNTTMNCLEYHRDSEINIGTEDFILLVARRDEIKNDVLDTSLVKAFRAPAGTAVEVFATTLHYAPCHTDASKGFRVAIVLPKGTNTDMPAFPQGPLSKEDTMLRACNKWLLAHKDAPEAKEGAYIGLIGENVSL